MTTATKNRGRPRRAETLPCARCGNPGGWANRKCGQQSPQRTDATRFGIDGKVCKACYVTLGRKARIKNPASVKPPRVVLPCARCGTPGGAIRRSCGCVTPSRYDGATFGIKGRVCLSCWNVLTSKNPFASQRHRTLKAKGKPRKTEKPEAATFVASRCADCGTSGGRSHNDGSGYPARHRGEPVGVPGMLCTRCYNRAYERRRREAARQLAEDTRDDAEMFRRVRLEKLRGYPLPVLTPGFQRDDLTPRAESRLLIREARKGGRL